MKKNYLVVVAVFAALCFNLQAQDFDLGYDWDGALVPAASGKFFQQNVLEHTLNAGTDDEIILIAGGATVPNTAPSATANSLYANGGISNISHIQLGNNQQNEVWFEARVTGPKVITAIKINGTSGSTSVATTGGVLFSSESPFDGNKIIGYTTAPFPVCRSGGAGLTFETEIPAGTKSFRIYNPAKIVVSGDGFALSTEGEVIMVGADPSNAFRLGYIKLTLGTGAPATTPSIANTSGAPVQNLLLGNSISNITYRWGGTATSATVTWTGGTPAGITVTPDNDAKTVTIAGTPTAAGTYSYSVTATDGAQTTEPLTGTITVTAPTKPVIAFIVKNVPLVDGGEIALLAKLSESYEVDLILNSSSTPASRFDSHVAILLSAVPSSGDVPTCLKGINKPLVTSKPFMFQASAWNWGGPANLHGTAIEGVIAIESVPSGIIVEDASHQIFAGLGLTNGAEVPLATDSKHGSKRILTPMSSWVGENETNIIKLGSVPASVAYNYTVQSPGSGTDISGAAVIFEIRPNSVMSDGTTIPQKTIHIGVSEQAYETSAHASLLTPQYLTIVKNAIDYVRGAATSVKPSPNADKNVIGTRYFDILGKEVPAASKGLIIRVHTFDNGSIEAEKVFIK
jgi:hypothetical protein